MCKENNRIKENSDERVYLARVRPIPLSANLRAIETKKQSMVTECCNKAQIQRQHNHNPPTETINDLFTNS